MTTLTALVRLISLSFVCLLSWDTMAADFVVIANLNSGIDKMTKDEVINVYMGRYRKLASGISAQPLDLINPLSEKSKFYAVMVNKELPEINSYWARLMFSGQGSPPLQVDNIEEVLEIVSSNKGAIAYIDRKKIDKRVKVVFDSSQ
ncbi:substrate-binding domain-containing protein [Undibacterium sp. Jales W-56]|uniref:substrate-binding domain-containing protein n=1 Tax=Undibacterium sp. Jales W-56 TaxID=2897325 RepID=UPI0021D22EB5|nr:substrate-binding domain-containing protein [Undibacterium sp. Jales W-56]MCU6435414.1 substrate-binding domain-containing protein [Undibacterium sp. Jales W-56]